MAFIDNIPSDIRHDYDLVRNDQEILNSIKCEGDFFRFFESLKSFEIVSMESTNKFYSISFIPFGLSLSITSRIDLSLTNNLTSGDEILNFKSQQFRQLAMNYIDEIRKRYDFIFKNGHAIGLDVFRIVSN